jgi:hypothetical protein
MGQAVTVGQYLQALADIAIALVTLAAVFGVVWGFILIIERHDRKVKRNCDLW